MPRPQYLPDTSHSFTVKRPVGVKNTAGYVASRLGLPTKWVERLIDGKNVIIVPPQLTNVPSSVPFIACNEDFNFKVNTIIEVNFPSRWMQHLLPNQMDLNIIHEDESMLVLDKPPGVVVHPARGHLDGMTLQNGVLHRYRREKDHTHVTIGPVHRLDKETSGIIVFSRTRDAYRRLTDQFYKKTVKKKYLAIANGIPDEMSFSISEPIGVDPENAAKSAILDVRRGGKEAHTDFTVLEAGKNWSLIEAAPTTGRAHQIRVHLAYAGLPLFGDKDYHPKHKIHHIERHALHACYLEIEQPQTGKRMKFESTMPADMRQLLDVLSA